MTYWPPAMQPGSPNNTADNRCGLNTEDHINPKHEVRQSSSTYHPMFAEFTESESQHFRIPVETSVTPHQPRQSHPLAQIDSAKDRPPLFLAVAAAARTTHPSIPATNVAILFKLHSCSLKPARCIGNRIVSQGRFGDLAPGTSAVGTFCRPTAGASETCRICVSRVKWKLIGVEIVITPGVRCRSYTASINCNKCFNPYDELFVFISDFRSLSRTRQLI